MKTTKSTLNVAEEPKKQLPKANTNPDFYIEDMGGKITIYSTLSNLCIGPPEYAAQMSDYFIGIPDTKTALTIYALNLTLAGEIKIPGGEVKIYCKKLDVFERKDKTKDKPVTISVEQPIGNIYDPADAANLTNNKTDGSKGTDGDDIARGLQDKGKKYATKGLKAGNITIICDSIELKDELYLLAKGSQGYPGFNGQKGAKGNGGADENVAIGYKDYYFDNNVHTREYFRESSIPPQAGGIGGAGGRGGAGGEGGEGGKIEIRYNSCNNASLIKINASGGDPGIPGIPGLSGDGGDGGRFYDYVEVKSGAVHFKGNRTSQGGHGLKGEIALPFLQGFDGISITESEIVLHQLGHYFNDMFLQKVMQKIKYWYLFNSPQQFSGDKVSYSDPEKWEEIGEHLQWMVNVMEDFYDSEVQDISVLRKKSLLLTAQQLLFNYQANRTYFGTPANYVPRIKIKDVKEKFVKSCANRKKLEEAFFKLAQEYATKKGEVFTKEDKVTHLTILVGVYEEMYKDFITKIEKQEQVVEQFHHELTKATTELLKAGDDFKKAVQETFNFSLEKLCRGLEMLAFTGLTTATKGGTTLPSPMVAVQLASFIYEGATTITDSQGHSVPKDYLINEFKTYEEDIVKNAVNDVMDYEGKFEEGNIKAIISSVVKVEEEISKIKDKIGNQDAVKNELGALERLKNAVIKKGEAIMIYNLNVSYFYDYYKKWEAANKMLKELKDGTQILDPYQVSVESYYAMLYQQMIERTVKDLYVINRKYIYLIFKDLLAEINMEEQMGGLWLTGDIPTGNFTTLVDKYDQLQDKETDYFAHQTSDYNPFPEDKKKRSDIMLTIDKTKNPELIEEFRKNRKMFFSTIPNSEKITRYNQFHVGAVEKKYNLRISHVQPRIIGAKTESKTENIEVEIKHMGRSTFEGYPFTGNNGPQYIFSHEPVNCILTHDKDTLPYDKTNDDIGQGLIGVIEGEHLDNVGIYADWLLMAEESSNPTSSNYKLDVSEVTAIIIHFRGYIQVKNIG